MVNCLQFISSRDPALHVFRLTPLISNDLTVSISSGTTESLEQASVSVVIWPFMNILISAF